MTIKEIFEKLKNKLEILFKTNTKSLPVPNDNRQVLISTYIKDLNIDTNLNDEELKRYNQYKEEELCKRGANIIIYANHLLRSAYPAMVDTARKILENGRSLEASEENCMSIKEILNLIPGGK